MPALDDAGARRLIDRLEVRPRCSMACAARRLQTLLCGASVGAFS
jgi:hypothetical protein